MRRRRPNGLSGIVRTARIIDPGSVPSTRAHAGKLRGKGASTRTMVKRQMYWAIQNASKAQQATQDRQDEQANVGHYDVAPNWDSSAAPVATAALETGPSAPQTAGTELVGGQSIPEGYIPPPS